MSAQLVVTLAVGTAVAAVWWRPRGRLQALSTSSTGGVSWSARPRTRGSELAVRVLVTQVQSLLRAGATPSAAWIKAAGLRVDGDGMPEIEGLTRLIGATHATAVQSATRLALNAGAPLGQVLDTVSDALVAEAEAESDREAALAGPRATARVLAWLPVAGALLAWILGADPVTVALDGGVGTACLGVGLILMAVGRWWTSRLVTAARQAGVPP